MTDQATDAPDRYLGTTPTDQQVADATAANRSFSRLLPGMQIAVDSTSLGTFKECPRKYYYSMILGIGPRSESAHLLFGSWMHGAIERYHHRRAAGEDHDQAVHGVTLWLLTETWDRTRGRAWNSEHNLKTRTTLVRSVVWYLDEVAERDVLETVVLANGKPACELSFSFDLDTATRSSAENVLACGHLDRIATLSGTPYIVDAKTTSGAVDNRFFQGFSPDNQFSLYALAGKLVFDIPVAGLVVDGIQVGVGFSRFGRGIVTRSAGQLSEFLSATQYWIAQMEQCAERLDWPMNEKSCGHFAGCHFRPICARTPDSRPLWLRTEYKMRTWDPLVRRGDV